MIERIVAIVLGVTLMVLAVRSLQEVRSAEAERDFWRNQYLLERRNGKVTDCHTVSEKYVICSYTPRRP
jgi:hypothetical protein